MVPAGAVPSHVLFALATFGAAAVFRFPTTAFLTVVLLVGLAGLVVRMRAAWAAGPRDAGRIFPLLAIGSLLVTSILGSVSLPLSLRGPEGSGPLFGGLTWIAPWVTYTFVFALFLLPLCMVASVWPLHDRPRQMVLGAGVVLWTVAAVLALPWPVQTTALSVLMGDVRSAAGPGGLLVLTFGFLYGLKSDAHLATTERVADPAGR